MTSPQIFERSPHSESTLEHIAEDAFRKHPSVLPRRPNAVLIERLIELAFGFNETYENLEKGLLGEIHFGVDDRPIGIRLARRLGDICQDPSIEHERRMTLAHECGHGLAHSKFFGSRLRRDLAPRLPGLDDSHQRIIHRNYGLSADSIEASSSEKRLEWEADYLMAALLLPRSLVRKFLAPWLSGQADGVSPRCLPDENLRSAISATATKFNVSRELAAKRISKLIPSYSQPDLFENHHSISVI